MSKISKNWYMNVFVTEAINVQRTKFCSSLKLTMLHIWFIFHVQFSMQWYGTTHWTVHSYNLTHTDYNQILNHNVIWKCLCTWNKWCVCRIIPFPRYLKLYFLRPLQFEVWNFQNELNETTRRCRHCQINFDSMQSLLEHTKNEHKLNSCKYCQKNFLNQTNLCQHIKAFHEDITCKKCGKVFKRRKYMIQHRKLHGVKKKKKFATMHNLWSKIWKC